MDRIAYAIFCDDIRFELGNKYTLNGVYSADMFLSEIPAFIPRVGVSIRIESPIDQPLKTARFKVLRGDEVIVDAEPAVSQQPATNLVLPEGHDVPTRSQYTFNAILPPMPIMGPCTLRAVVVADGIERVAGKLRIGPVREEAANVAPSV